jgi:hypothetical protein
MLRYNVADVQRHRQKRRGSGAAVTSTAPACQRPSPPRQAPSTPHSRYRGSNAPPALE